MSRLFHIPLLVMAVQTFAAAQEVTCLIEPWERVELSTPVEGIVGDVRVDRGDRVHAGMVVATLDSDVEEARLALARARADNDAAIQARRARLGFLENQLARTLELRRRNAVSEAAVDEIVAETESARQQLREAEIAAQIARLEVQQAEALLRQRTLVSPIDGIVIERRLARGEYRNEQAHLVTIAQLDPLRVEVFLPVDLYGELAPGGTATVLPEPPIGGRHEATIVVVDQVVDAASGTFGVRLELSNPDFTVPAGVRCDVRFHGLSD